MFMFNSGHMTKMTAMPIYGKDPSLIDCNEACHVASGRKVLKCVYKA